MADVEDQTPVDDVGVRRDDPVGTGVGPVGKARLQPDPHPVLVPFWVTDVEVVHLFALCVVDAHRPERPADVLVELEDHLLGLCGHRRA